MLKFFLLRDPLIPLEKEIRKMSKELNRLTKEVAETNTAVDSVMTLVEGLAQQIRDNADDPTALDKLADDLDKAQTKIAEAVQKNTAPPEAPAEPAPEEVEHVESDNDRIAREEAEKQAAIDALPKKEDGTPDFPPSDSENTGATPFQGPNTL